MKKLLNFFIIFIIGLFTCSCTHDNTDLCTSFKEIPFDYKKLEYIKSVSDEYLEKDYEYTVKCKIKPALNQNNYNKELDSSLNKLSRIANSLPFEKCYDILRENLIYSLWYELGSIPQNTDKYKTLWEEDNYIFDAVAQCDNLGCKWEDIEKIIYHLIQEFDKKGYFNDYKIADMFIKSIDIICTVYEGHSIYDFEPECIKIAKYNENKPKAFYNLKFLGGLFYNNEMYYYNN